MKINDSDYDNLLKKVVKLPLFSAFSRACSFVCASARVTWSTRLYPSFSFE